MNYSLYTEIKAFFLGSDFSREDFEVIEAITNYRGGGKTTRELYGKDLKERPGTINKTWGKQNQNEMRIKYDSILINLKDEHGTREYFFDKREKTERGSLVFSDEQFGGIHYINCVQKGDCELSWKYYDEEAVNYALEQNPAFLFESGTKAFAALGINPDIETTETIKDGNFVEVLGKISVGKLRKKVEEAYQSQPKKL